MREVELKAVVDDIDERCRRVEAAGARLLFSGRMEDRRYDTPVGVLGAQDVVMRLRIYRSSTTITAQMDWKEATQRVDGFKVRQELTTSIGDPDALAAMLHRLGYVVIREIDREIIQYGLDGTVVRFERYPRMDTLVEVEGTPDDIEAAIRVIGLPRNSFTTERLPDFIKAYEKKSGTRAAVCDRELAGDYRYRVTDA
jgi:predicted adenylyl cyclase CyaB